MSSFTELGRPFTRIVFSSEFVDARKWLQNLPVTVVSVSKVDDGGSPIGTRAAKLNKNKKVIIGSHIDTVPAGGRFDGGGVIAALEVVIIWN